MEWKKLEREDVESHYKGLQFKCPNCNQLVCLNSLIGRDECAQCETKIELGVRHPKSVDVKEKSGDVESDE